MKYGFSNKQLKEIVSFFREYSEVEEAVLFGSRAIDTYKEASDVDIALKGNNVTASLSAKMKFNIEEDTYLPFFFDFIAYSTITSEELKQHIRNKGVVIYRRGRGWKEEILEDIAFVNPTESLRNGKKAKKVAMEILQPFTKKIHSYPIEEYKGGVKFKNGDTLVARITPSLENGKTAFVDFLDENEIGFGSTEFIVLREKENVSYNHFLYYLAISPEFRKAAILSMTGSSGRQRVQTEVVKNHSFLLPPLSEQKAIAAVLCSLDDKIDLLHRQNKTLEAMAETLFRQWFVEESQDDWEEKTLSRIAEHKKVNLQPKKNPSTIYHHYSIPTFDERQQPISEFGLKIQSNKYKVFPNAILISKLNPRFPRVWAIPPIIKDNSICSTEFQVVLPISNEWYGFIYCLLKSKQVSDELIGAAGGTSGSHQRVKPEDIFNITFSVPDKETLSKFDVITRDYWPKININRKQIYTLEKLRDTLLPKLMRGEIRVKGFND
ncbi:MAG: restriction endonuclease subunit S [Bacteroidota bacterium]